jgi:hypothetical protein
MSPLEHFVRLAPAVYSNCDHQINIHIAEALQSNPNRTYAQHAALNFCGYVWFADGKWHEEVWVYGSEDRTFRHVTLRALIDEVNEVYGRD